MSLTPTKSDDSENNHRTSETRSSSRGLMSQLSWTFGRKGGSTTGGDATPPTSNSSATRLTPSNRQMSWKFGLSSSHSRNDASVDGRSNHSQASSQRTTVVDEDFDGSHTRSELENVISHQDADITVLEKARQEKQQELAALQKELYEEKLLQMKDSILHQIETERLQRQTRAVKELLSALEKDMQDKDAIHEYANLIKGVAPKGGVDSQYVMKLQSQLAKAVKKMDATSQQMTLLEQSCDEVVASLKNEISDIVEERCRTELDLRRQLEQLEDQRTELKAAYEERIRENRREIERLKQRAQTEGAPVDVYKELEEAEHRLLELSLPQDGEGSNLPATPPKPADEKVVENGLLLPQDNETPAQQSAKDEVTDATLDESSSPSGNSKQVDDAIVVESSSPGGDAEQVDDAIVAESSSPGGDAEQADDAIVGESSSPGGDAEQADDAIVRESSSPGGDAGQANDAIVESPSPPSDTEQGDEKSESKAES